MDPFLEPRWSDVHASLIHLAKAALQPLLPEALRARSEEQVFIEDEKGTRERFEADTVVIELPRSSRTGTERTSASAIAEPIVIEKTARQFTERWIQIIDISDGSRVVTAIEFLSPANKRAGRHNRRYLRKVGRYLDAGVNLVEVDLLRSSRERLPIKRSELPPGARKDYVACVARAAEPGFWGVTPMPLRSPLPGIRIPLRHNDAELTLDLQALIERVYVEGGHDDIDYQRAIKPTLDPDDAAWLRERIGQREHPSG